MPGNKSNKKSINPTGNATAVAKPVDENSQATVDGVTSATENATAVAKPVDENSQATVDGVTSATENATAVAKPVDEKSQATVEVVTNATENATNVEKPVDENSRATVEVVTNATENAEADTNLHLNDSKIPQVASSKVDKVSIEKLWHVLGKYLGKNVSGKENDKNHVSLNGSTVTQMSVIAQENSSPPVLVQDSTVLATGNISQNAKEEIEKFISVAANTKLPLETLAGTVDIKDYFTTKLTLKYWNKKIISNFRSLGLDLIEESRGVGGGESNYYGIKNVEDMTIGVQLRVINAQLSEYFVFWLPTKVLPENIDELRATENSLKQYVNDQDACKTEIIIKTSGGQRKKSQKRNKKRSRQTQKGNRNAK